MGEDRGLFRASKFVPYMLGNPLSFLVEFSPALA